MNLKMTDDLVSKLNNAVEHWDQYIHDSNAEPGTIEKYFDHWCKETCGLTVTLAENTSNYGHRWLTWETANVNNEEKYIWFLLSF